MLRIIPMLQIINLLLVFVSVMAWADDRIVFSVAQMQEHKKLCINKMRSNPANLNNPSYQLQRAISNISGDDADYIPKVIGAGEIFYEGTIPYQLMHNGVKVILNSYYDAAWMTDVIYGLKGHHEPQEEKCFYEVLKYIPENAVMIELGSYWAYYSLWFSFDIKGARNYLIEPDPKRLETGKKNFELNKKTGFFKRGFAGIKHDMDPDYNGADWISIDDFLERQGIAHVAILHSDIQGAEAAMLETAVNHLSVIDYFFISTHDPETAHKPCLQFFKRHNFIILTEYVSSQSCGCDGLIVAKRPGVAGPDFIPVRIY